MSAISSRFSPTLIFGLTAIWLILNETLAPGQIFLGAVLAALLAGASSLLRPWQARVRRLDVAAALALVVLHDIVRSNISVARIVLGLQGRNIVSGLLDIPLELRDPHGLAALAAIITSTPGTVWVGLSPDGATLTLHVLDLHEEGDLIRAIKERYEAPLRRIFE